MNIQPFAKFCDTPRYSVNAIFWQDSAILSVFPDCGTHRALNVIAFSILVRFSEVIRCIAPVCCAVVVEDLSWWVKTPLLFLCLWLYDWFASVSLSLNSQWAVGPVIGSCELLWVWLDLSALDYLVRHWSEPQGLGVSLQTGENSSRPLKTHSVSFVLGFLRGS